MMNLRDFKRPVRISTPPKSNKRPLKKAAISKKKKRSSVPTQQLIFQATSSFSPGGSLFLLNIQMRMTHRWHWSPQGSLTVSKANNSLSFCSMQAMKNKLPRSQHDKTRKLAVPQVEPMEHLENDGFQVGNLEFQGAIFRFHVKLWRLMVLGKPRWWMNMNGMFTISPACRVEWMSYFRLRTYKEMILKEIWTSKTPRRLWT